MTVPASRSRVTTPSSTSGTKPRIAALPAVISTPATMVRSLIGSGTPSSGAGSPSASRAAASSACRRARSGVSRANAPTPGPSRSARSSVWASTSCGVVSPDRIAPARARALSSWISVTPTTLGGAPARPPSRRRRSARCRRELAVAPEHAELVALRVGPRHPAGARAVLAAAVGEHGGAGADQPVDLLLLGAVRGAQVEVQAVLDRLGLGHLDEQHVVAAVAGEDHALLVARLVRVVRHVDVVQQLPPPLRQLVGVAAVDARVRDARGHHGSLRGPAPATQRDCRRPPARLAWRACIGAGSASSSSTTQPSGSTQPRTSGPRRRA